MINIKLNNETDFLKAVIVGIANDFGGTPQLDACYDPKSRAHVYTKSFPVEKDLVNEMESFVEILNKYDVKVYRPSNISGINQIFCRDIAFVIDDKFFIPNIISNRKKEILGIDHVLAEIDPLNIVNMPLESRAEGGDIVLFNDYIFVGYSKHADFKKYLVSRTNELSVQFLKEQFPNKKVLGFELQKSDKDARFNALHLDCCFQPIGKNMAIVYKDGFKNSKDLDFLYELFNHNVIEINQQEMYDMNSNFFSISDEVIVSEKGFKRINNLLKKKGFYVEEVCFSETAKMEGLLRCSTLPLIRKK